MRREQRCRHGFELTQITCPEGCEIPGHQIEQAANVNRIVVGSTVAGFVVESIDGRIGNCIAYSGKHVRCGHHDRIASMYLNRNARRGNEMLCKVCTPSRFRKEGAL